MIDVKLDAARVTVAVRGKVLHTRVQGVLTTSGAYQLYRLPRPEPFQVAAEVLCCERAELRVSTFDLVQAASMWRAGQVPTALVVRPDQDALLQQFVRMRGLKQQLAALFRHRAPAQRWAVQQVAVSEAWCRWLSAPEASP